MGLNLVFKILVSKNYFGPAKGFHVHFSRTFWKCGAKVWRGAFSKYPIGGAKVKGLIYYGGAHLGKNLYLCSSSEESHSGFVGGHLGFHEYGQLYPVWTQLCSKKIVKTKYACCSFPYFLNQ